jgi:hypothetical protein
LAASKPNYQCSSNAGRKCIEGNIANDAVAAATHQDLTDDEQQSNTTDGSQEVEFLWTHAEDTAKKQKGMAKTHAAAKSIKSNSEHPMNATAANAKKKPDAAAKTKKSCYCSEEAQGQKGARHRCQDRVRCYYSEEASQQGQVKVRCYYGKYGKKSQGHDGARR